MTLGDSVTLFQSRVDTDVDCDFDSTDTAKCTTAIMAAAYRVARDAYYLWTWESLLTLAAADQSIDTMSSKSAAKVFHVYGVYINGQWLQEYRYRDFLESFPSYHTASNSDKPGAYTLTAPSNIYLDVPVSATAAAATNHITGFRTQTTLAYASASTELDGPSEYHELIVDRAYLDSSKSYVTGATGYERRALIEADYQEKTRRLKAFNMATFKKETRRAGIGNRRMVRSVGGSF